MAIEYDLIQKSGGWFTMPNGDRIQGLKNVTGYYDTHSEELEQLTEQVKNKLKGIELGPVFEVNEETGEVIDG